MKNKLILDKEDIFAFKPHSLQKEKNRRNNNRLKLSLSEYNLLTPEQVAGRNFPIACVSLEITQRCNLDCSLCYLSDLAEVVKDVPLFELNRRIKMIYDHYGKNTNIQISGGDPTLRKTSDLVEIVKSIKSYGMRSALFTNGILAKRKMLKALADAGLNDVAFHVDLTQERKGYETEAELNKVRLEYIERAKGLPLRVLFNTTVFDQNIHEIPELVSFFTKHADKINMASFQMQAETGRGVSGARNEDLITQQRMMNLIEQGVGTKLSFDLPLIGHPDCNKYSAILKSGSSITPLYQQKKFFTELFQLTAKDDFDWNQDRLVILKMFKKVLSRPTLIKEGLIYSFKVLWGLKGGLIRGKKPHRLSFFIHNFMDAKKLEKERCETCVFHVITSEGPLSMCVHNAKRDHMISQKVGDWNPIEETEKEEILNLSKDLAKTKFKGKLRVERDLKENR